MRNSQICMFFIIVCIDMIQACKNTWFRHQEANKGMGAEK